MKPHERRQEQTRNDLIDQALAMIVESGISGLSIRSLADSLDYTPGALYTYFSGKDELIDAARERCFAEFNHELGTRMARHETAADMLVESGLAYIDFARYHPNKYFLMFGMESSPATSGEQRDVAMSSLLGVLNRGLDTGEFVLPPGYDLETAATHCWATVHGIASLLPTVLFDEKESTSKRARRVVESREKAARMSEIILRRVVDGFSPTSQG
jgi:AcrR family transcriptional regulator